MKRKNKRMINIEKEIRKLWIAYFLFVFVSACLFFILYLNIVDLEGYITFLEANVLTKKILKHECVKYENITIWSEIGKAFLDSYEKVEIRKPDELESMNDCVVKITEFSSTCEDYLLLSNKTEFLKLLKKGWDKDTAFRYLLENNLYIGKMPNQIEITNLNPCYVEVIVECPLTKQRCVKHKWKIVVGE